MTDAPDELRCTARVGALQCVREYDHDHGHVAVSGSYVTDKHQGN